MCIKNKKEQARQMLKGNMLFPYNKKQGERADLVCSQIQTTITSWELHTDDKTLSLKLSVCSKLS